MESHHGTELVEGAVYEFHKPDPGERIQVEILFMHGLQVKVADLKGAYYKTWRTADGNEVWPETWLKDKYPNARILSLAYDSSARKTGTAGNMTPYLLGESLLHEMVSTKANIGQNDCPVVFVCHSLGGLIAKEIVVRCNSDRANVEYQNLLRNLKAVFFYATPHGGSDLADSWISRIADWFPFVRRSSLVGYLNPKGTDRTHTHHDFLQAVNNDCKFYVVAEGRETKFFKGLRMSSAWIVPENSARFPGRHDFVLHKDADHRTVCKPQSANDAGYLKLTDCIDQVLKEYRGRTTIDLSVSPIGIGGKINKISELLERVEVTLVFLFGMAGAGKTTLSKEFYNRKAFKYEKSCFLEKVKSRKIEDVQKELLQGLCGEKLNQHESVKKQHLDMIKNCLLEQKVLLVIDDVSSEEHLEKLQIFYALETASQSKVVVTGRDNTVLPKQHVNSDNAVIERVDGISDGSDLELFLHYAFQAIDPDNREEVNQELLAEAKKIVQLCNGLPLSLEVLGKYLGNSRDKDENLQQWKKTWVDAHARLQRAESIDGNKSDKLWSSLRISYDNLGDLEQKMFLDFACIFSGGNGIRKRYIEEIWDSPCGVKNLVSKSLLKVEGGCFVMHDQLRDMGRHMLLKEATDDYQYPLYFRQRRTKGYTVPYIASFEQEEGTSLRQYSKLRFFTVEKCDTPSLVDECLSQCPKGLRYLRLRNSGITPIGLQKLGSFGELRVLKIHDPDLVVLPKAIGSLKNLLELEMRSCPNLQSLPDSIGELENLKRLEVYCLSGLQVIPGSIGKLKNLKVLIVERSGLQVIPDSVGDLECSYLSFYGCNQLTVIYYSQICTKKLVTLRVPVVPTGCLRRFPELRELHIGTGCGEFPQDFFKMDVPKLEVVKWYNYSHEEKQLRNPDGSQLVVKAGLFGECSFRVERDSNGSISRLTPTGPRPIRTIKFHSKLPLLLHLTKFSKKNIF